MKHKVVRYKNYGCAFDAGEDTDNWRHKFYWSFYELNNGKIIKLDNTEYWENDKLSNQKYDYTYAKSELLSGDIHSYNFGDAKASDDNAMSKEFFQWFDSLPPHHLVKKKNPPTKEEINCVDQFYLENVMNKKDKKTNTIFI